MPPAHRSPFASLPLVLILATALLGCAATRERLPALDPPDVASFRPTRPGWLRLDDAHAWRRLPLVARLFPYEPGEIRGTVQRAAARGAAKPADVLVYLDPAEPGDRPQAIDAPPVVRRQPGRFEPSFLVVVAGRTVVFGNHDRIYHRIFSYSEPNAFDLGVLAQGESRTVTFAEPGEVRFYCALHPGESGVVFVTPSPWFALAEPSGEYRIAGVPPGEYRLRTWSASGPSVTRAVTVRPGIAADVDVSLR